MKLGLFLGLTATVVTCYATLKYDGSIIVAFVLAAVYGILGRRIDDEIEREGMD